jgi:DUF1680 family protein
VDGTSYKPDTVQKVHQAYGRDYQLPNFSAHNETCANIGNVLWNWRMLQVTAEAKYADIVELTLYNSVLSGISMDGSKFFYTNPLAATADYPYQLRWEGGRVPYISKSNCCPPNTIADAEVSEYMYSIADEAVYINMYGRNKLSTNLKDGSAFKLEQQATIPGWKYHHHHQRAATPVAIHHGCGWCKSHQVKINGKTPKVLKKRRIPGSG